MASSSKSHFAEGDAEVVVCFGILVGGSNVGFEILLEFSKHLRKIDPSILGEGRGLSGGSSRSVRNRNDRRLRLGDFNGCMPGHGRRRDGRTWRRSRRDVVHGGGGCGSTRGQRRSDSCSDHRRRNRGRSCRGRHRRRLRCGCWRGCFRLGCGREKVFPERCFNVGNKLAKNRRRCVPRQSRARYARPGPVPAGGAAAGRGRLGHRPGQEGVAQRAFEIGNEFVENAGCRRRFGLRWHEPRVRARPAQVLRQRSESLALRAVRARQPRELPQRELRRRLLPPELPRPGVPQAATSRVGISSAVSSSMTGSAAAAASCSAAA